MPFPVVSNGRYTLGHNEPTLTSPAVHIPCFSCPTSNAFSWKSASWFFLGPSQSPTTWLRWEWCPLDNYYWGHHSEKNVSFLKEICKRMFVLATLIPWMVLSLKNCFIKIQRKHFVIHCGLIGSLLVRPGEMMSVLRHQTDFLSQIMFFKSEPFVFILLLFLIWLTFSYHQSVQCCLLLKHSSIWKPNLRKCVFIHCRQSWNDVSRLE